MGKEDKMEGYKRVEDRIKKMRIKFLKNLTVMLICLRFFFCVKFDVDKKFC